MTLQAAPTQALNIAVQIQAPIAQVYHCFTTRSGWSDWFAEKGFGHVAPGSILEVQHHTAGHVAILFEEFSKNARVRFKYSPIPELDPSNVEILFEETADGTAISLTHTDLSPELEEKQASVWQKSLDALKAIFETGQDPRLWGRPFLGVTVEEWVTPEYAAEHNLPTESGMHLSSVFEGRGAEQAGIRGNDVIVSLAGNPLENYDDLQNVFAIYRSGATIEVTFYQGDELKTSQLTLSEYPVPEVPANAQDIAEKVEHFYKKVNASIEAMLEDKLEAQTEFRPAAGEWNAKEIIAHLIASETDTLNWLSTYIAGREVHSYTSGTPAVLKALTSVYPTTAALMEKFRQTQLELTTLLSGVPADVVSRKPSLVRLALNFSLNMSLHYKNHLNQLKQTLEAAADVRGS